jgi:hypothetical protein
MPTLYLHAPWDRTQQGIGAFYKDFYTILKNCIGPDYAIYGRLIGQVGPGTKAVVFDRIRGLRAEGVVSALTPKPSKRVQRYDVHIPDLAQVPYIDPPPVNRCGVAIG